MLAAKVCIHVLANPPEQCHGYLGSIIRIMQVVRGGAPADEVEERLAKQHLAWLQKRLYRAEARAAKSPAPTRSPVLSPTLRRLRERERKLRDAWSQVHSHAHTCLAPHIIRCATRIHHCATHIYHCMTCDK